MKNIEEQQNQKKIDGLALRLFYLAQELIQANEEKNKRADELRLANIKLAFQNQQKDKRAYELSLANIELAFQSQEKEKLRPCVDGRCVLLDKKVERNKDYSLV